MQTFHNYKKQIDAYLLLFLESKREAFARVNPYGPDLLDRVKKMAVAGKTIRGSLVLLSYSFTNKMPSDDALKLSTAMELMRTALVIHDDIMDGDRQRRGMPAMHVQYKSVALAMCAADTLFFLAFELVGHIQTDEITLGRIIRLFGREYQSVGIAQMADVGKTPKTKEEILSLYTHKTARYTFALPLMAGAILAGTTKDMLKYLESYGVAVGVLFQIRDDSLDHEPILGEPEIHAYQTAARESIKRLPEKKILTGLLQFVMMRSL